VSGVTYSPALKWSVIILLPLTIGWKVAAKPENPVEIQNAIVEFLTQQQFDVSVTDENMEYMGMIDARSRSCQLQVSRVSPLGHQAEIVRRASATGDRTFYVFRGTVSPEQPVRLVSSVWCRAFPRCSPSSPRVMRNSCLGAYWVRSNRYKARIASWEAPMYTNADRFLQHISWPAHQARARAPGPGTRPIR